MKNPTQNILKLLGMVAVTGTLLLGSMTARAQGIVLRNSPRLMQGIRPQGMGGAFIAVEGTDENALFYNPAAINDFSEEFHFQFLLPSVEMSYKAIQFLSDDIPNLADDIDAATTDAAKTALFRNFTNANAGRYEEVGVRGSVAHMMNKWITASIFYDNRSLVSLTNPASATVDVEALTQFGLQVGSAYSFFDKHLQAGLALKFVERHLVDETITQREVVANNDFGDSLDLNNFGFGVGMDLGAKGRLPIHGKVWEYLDPVFAATLQDIGHTRFTNDLGQMKQSLSWGLALHPNYWKLKSVFALDFRDLDHHRDFFYRVHAGYEVMWPEISKVLRTASVRLGLNQGYITAGFGLDFKYFKLNAATYGREVASQKAFQKQSRMFGLQLASGF